MGRNKKFLILPGGGTLIFGPKIFFYVHHLIVVSLSFFLFIFLSFFPSIISIFPCLSFLSLPSGPCINQNIFCFQVLIEVHIRLIIYAPPGLSFPARICFVTVSHLNMVLNAPIHLSVWKKLPLYDTLQDQRIICWTFH